MAETEKYARTILRREGWLCLDFANTATWHASDHPTEHLHSYIDLVNWAKSSGIFTESEVVQHLRSAEMHPVEAANVLRNAINLRETIYRIFSAVTERRLPEPSDISTLNVALAEGTGHFQIVPGQEGFAWDWNATEERLDAMLWLVARSAANLLTGEDLDRVGRCADDRGCGWLFLDISRNRSRRWCSMEDCGNRAKARLHYKHKQQLSEVQTDS